MNRGLPDWQPLTPGSEPPQLRAARIATEASGGIVALAASDLAHAGGWAPHAALEIARFWSSARTVRLIDLAVEVGDAGSGPAAVGGDPSEGLVDQVLFGASAARVFREVEDRILVCGPGTPIDDPAAILTETRWFDMARALAESGDGVLLYIPLAQPGAASVLTRADGIIVLRGEQEPVDEYLGGVASRTVAVLGPAGAAATAAPSAPAASAASAASAVDMEAFLGADPDDDGGLGADAPASDADDGDGELVSLGLGWPDLDRGDGGTKQDNDEGGDPPHEWHDIPRRGDGDSGPAPYGDDDELVAEPVPRLEIPGDREGGDAEGERSSGIGSIPDSFDDELSAFGDIGSSLDLIDPSAAPDGSDDHVEIELGLPDSVEEVSSDVEAEPTPPDGSVPWVGSDVWGDPADAVGADPGPPTVPAEEAAGAAAEADPAPAEAGEPAPAGSRSQPRTDGRAASASSGAPARPARPARPKVARPPTPPAKRSGTGTRVALLVLLIVMAYLLVRMGIIDLSWFGLGEEGG